MVHNLSAQPHSLQYLLDTLYTESSHLHCWSCLVDIVCMLDLLAHSLQSPLHIEHGCHQSSWNQQHMHLLKQNTKARNSFSYYYWQKQITRWFSKNASDPKTLWKQTEYSVLNSIRSVFTLTCVWKWKENRFIESTDLMPSFLHIYWEWDYTHF